MPTYDYRCSNGHGFELFHRMSDPAPSACPVCGVAPVERVLGPVAVHFKGSGFYTTDYGRGAKKDGATDGGAAAEPKKEKDKATPEKAPSSTSASDSSSSSSSPSSD